MIAACRKHGKHPGMGGVYEPGSWRNTSATGMRFILCGGDLTFFMEGADGPRHVHPRPPRLMSPAYQRNAQGRTARARSASAVVRRGRIAPRWPMR